MELKVQDDGLSTDWIVNKSISPIYSGGKVSQNTSDVIGTLNNGNVSLLTLNNKNTNNESDKNDNYNLDINSLFKEDEYQDEVLCFCLNPHIDHRNEIVIALRNNLIAHWDYVNKKRLLARLSFTDFDGKNFMKEYKKNKAIDDSMIKRCAPKVVEGVDKLKKWSETI